MIGEIGGSSEEEAAEFIKSSKIKKAHCWLYSWKLQLPAGRRMGHAGAIISGGKGNARGQNRKNEILWHFCGRVACS